jgi:hypothetical protein
MASPSVAANAYASLAKIMDSPEARALSAKSAIRTDLRSARC